MFASSIRSSEYLNKLENNYTCLTFDWSLTWVSSAGYNRRVGALPNNGGRFLPFYLLCNVISRTNNTVSLSISGFGTWNSGTNSATANIFSGTWGIGSTTYAANAQYFSQNAGVVGTDTSATFLPGTEIGLSSTGGSGGNTFNVRFYLYGVYLPYT